MGGAAGDTIVALSSGRLPAAIAIVRCSGRGALAAANTLAGSLPPPRHAGLRALRDPVDGSLIDRALVIHFPGPGTSTGEDIVEFQCHGSRAVVTAVIAALVTQPNVRAAEPGEFTRRSLAHGRIDLTQAEGLAELLEAESEAQRKSALLRAEGVLRRQIEQWRVALLDLAAEAEVAIDYADEEDGAGNFEPARRLEQLRAEFRILILAPRVERLRDGVRIVIAGPPNAGKSSLLNALANEDRAIVTPIAGTTRDLVEVALSFGGYPVTMVDTAGLRATAETVERLGVHLAKREIERADVLLWLGEAADLPTHPRNILVASKSDLAPLRPGVQVSTVTGAGLDTLKSLMTEQAATLVPSGEQPALTGRESDLLAQARSALERASALIDPVLIAEELRLARTALDRISGHQGVDALLDALFGRFCLGK